MSDEKVVLDHDDLRRTLVRIAHEIVEKNEESDRLALVGIHTRGAVICRRLHALVGELSGADVPLGDLDISFYRDDIERREPRDAPVVHDSHLDFDLAGRTIVLVDDVLYTGRTVRAAIDALFDYGRPARVQLAVLADRGHRELPIRPDYVGKNLPTAPGERVNVRLEETDGTDEVAITPADTRRDPKEDVMKHLLGVEDLSREEMERILERAESFAEVGRRDIKKVPTLRGRTIVNLFYEASTRTLSSFELAAKRLSADVVSVKSAGSSVDKGESLKDTVATLSAYDPAAIVIRSPSRRGGRPGRRVDRGVGDQRRRRQARAPDPGPARRLHPAPARRLARGPRHLDRRGRPPQPGRPVLPARLPEDGGEGDALRAAHADPARDRVARLRGLLRPRRAGRGRCRLRPADAARAHERELRPLAPRVRRAATRSTRAAWGRASC